MNTKTPTLNKELRQRVLAGESKSAIYRDYNGTALEKQAARSLALVATPENRRAYTPLNRLLLFLVGFLTLFQLYVIIFILFPTLPLPARVVVLGVSCLVNFTVLYLIATFNIFGCFLFIVFALRGMSQLMENFKVYFQPGLDLPTHLLILDCANGLCLIASVVLSFLLLRKLFPKTSFFLSPKRDAAGNPIFEN